MKFIDLKRPIQEKTPAPGVSAGPEDPYPYGLRIHLEQEELDKLGLDIDQFEVGEEISFLAKGEIVSISENQSENSESQSLGIQIQEIGLDQPRQSVQDAYRLAKNKIERKALRMNPMSEES